MSKDKPVQVLVEALETGTYPEPGGKLAWLRNRGDRFYVSSREHLSAWMKEVKESDPPLAPVVPPNVPQTTSPVRPIVGDFPVNGR